MKNIFSHGMAAAAVLFMALADSCPADSVKDLEKSYLAKFDQIKGDHDIRTEKLKTSYLAALHKYQEKVQKSGKLERVIPVRAEISAVEAGTEPLPSLAGNSAYEFKQLRAKYIDARNAAADTKAKALVELASRMNDLLKAEEEKLTRNGQIDAAIEAKKVGEALGKDPEVVAAKLQLEARENSDANPGDWRPLLSEKLEIVSKGNWHVGVLASTGPTDRAYAPIVEQLKKMRIPAGEILMSPAPAKIKFRLKDQVTTIRGECFLGNAGGDVTFRIKADDKLVFEKRVSGKITEQKFEASFEPTRDLELEVDSMGDHNHDWSSWLGPTVR